MTEYFLKINEQCMCLMWILSGILKTVSPETTNFKRRYDSLILIIKWCGRANRSKRSRRSKKISLGKISGYEKETCLYLNESN